MHTKDIRATVLSGLLLASPLAMAEEAPPAAEATPASGAMAMGPGMGMMQGGKGMMQGGKGMMQGGKGGMGMMRGGKGMMGGGMHEKHRRLMGRLDLLDARLAKIETMLERLLAR